MCVCTRTHTTQHSTRAWCGSKWMNGMERKSETLCCAVLCCVGPYPTYNRNNQINTVLFSMVFYVFECYGNVLHSPPLGSTPHDSTQFGPSTIEYISTQCCHFSVLPSHSIPTIYCCWTGVKWHSWFIFVFIFFAFSFFFSSAVRLAFLLCPILFLFSLIH